MYESKKLCENCGNKAIRTFRYRTDKLCGKITEYFFCTKECFNEFKTKHKTPTLVYLKTCTRCNKIYQVKYNNKNQKEYFCSKECRDKYSEENNHAFRNCSWCGKQVKRTWDRAKDISYCSPECRGKYIYDSIQTNCLKCGKEITRRRKHIAKSKYVFCSLQCGNTYRNQNDRRTGSSISKPERYIQAKLLELYPDIEFLFNDRQYIGSELDILIPELKISFELNGIFHYEAIHGQETLEYIQGNDRKKMQKCMEKGIDFVTIDITQLKYLKPDRIAPYLKIITDLIDLKLNQLNSELQVKQICIDRL